MISPFDDYCIHQAPGYLRVPGTTDRNFYDRYFFLGYTPGGEVIFGIGFGRYPNRYVQDGHFTVMLNGVQHSFHVSDVLGGDPARCTAGPFEIRVEEPMRRLRCRLAENDTGIACDLVYEAGTGAIDEGRLRVDREGMTYIDQTRFMQYGRWHGWIEVDGERTEISRGDAWGLRDKSWGVRLIGEQHATQRKGGQIFWMNLVLKVEPGFCVFRTLDHADGSSHEREGYCAPLYDSPSEVPVGETSLRKVADWNFDLDFEPGTRRISGGRYTIDWEDGGSSLIEASAKGTLWYAGMGYNHEQWHHGLDHGGQLEIERETWKASDMDPGDIDRQFLASVMEYRSEGRVIGFGHTEQLLMGEYQPLGWPADKYAGL